VAANRRYQQGTDALDQAASEWFGINRTDLRCMDVVLQRGRLSAGELATAAGLSPGAVTAALDRLERAGYAVRVRDTADRRRVLVEPTESAIDGAEQVYGPLREAGSSVIERFSRPQLAAIADFLERAADMQLSRATQLREQLEREGPMSGQANTGSASEAIASISSEARSNSSSESTGVPSKGRSR
jgi:DNA-binding MarR family transcriptional regulator